MSFSYARSSLVDSELDIDSSRISSHQGSKKSKHSFQAPASISDDDDDDDDLLEIDLDSIKPKALKFRAREVQLKFKPERSEQVPKYSAAEKSKVSDSQLLL